MSRTGRFSDKRGTLWMDNCNIPWTNQQLSQNQQLKQNKVKETKCTGFAEPFQRFVFDVPLLHK